jgi:hypothetical protein
VVLRQHGQQNGMKNGVDYAYNNHIILLVPILNRVFTTGGGPRDLVPRDRLCGIFYRPAAAELE